MKGGEKKYYVINLLTLVINQKYFQIFDKIYTCNKGLIMGNPLSPF